MGHKKAFIGVLLASFIVYAYCAKRVNLSCAQIRAFVDGHNFRRLRVAQGTVLGQPAASDMRFMVWDEELAEKAAKWAENGIFAHNPNKTIDSRRWDVVGENIYYSSFWGTGLLANVDVIPNIDEALNAWFDEHLDYGFIPFQLGTKKQIGHYTQKYNNCFMGEMGAVVMVWANCNRVGCAISQNKTKTPEKTETFTLFVCNYGPTGNYFEQLPYKACKFPGNLQCMQGECLRPYGKECSF